MAAKRQRASQRERDNQPARGNQREDRHGRDNGERAQEPHDDTAPRAFWSGTLTFGLVSVPVDLYPAVRSRRAPLRMLGPNGQLLQRRYYCSADDKPLSNDEIVRGYQWPDGSFTLVEDEELAALAPRKSRDIDLQRFVPRDEIPPKLLERPYVLAPAGDSTKAYHLLAKTMEQTGRAGVATFVMRGREYLAAIFSEGGLLRAATLRFADELRTPDSIGLPRARKVAAEDKRAVERALAELETGDLDRAALADDYTAAVLALAEKKRDDGRDVIEVAEDTAEDPTDLADVIDIMSVLRERLGAARAPAKSDDGAQEPRREPRRAARKSDDALGDLERKSKKELYERAKALRVENRSAMTKEQLVEAIRAAG
jgi:DNA end-binding protein Ku